MITVLIVEDHQSVARTIARFLERNVGPATTDIVGSAEAALEYLAQLTRTNKRLPDLALVDVSLPGMSGIELVGQLHERYPHLYCLMLSGHKEPAYVRRSLEQGARGYVAKGNPAAIIEGLQCVLDGEIYVSEELGVWQL